MTLRRRPLTLLLAAAAAATAAMPALPSAPTRVPTEQDDAGTGTDAGTEWDTAISVERGVEYSATLVPNGLSGASITRATRGGGDLDWFSFHAQQGEAFTVELLDQSLTSAPNCISVMDREGQVIATSGCSDVAAFIAPHDGEYVAQFGYFAVVPDTYRFVVDPAPDATGVGYSTAAREMRPDPEQPTVVVAVADTGVNPYHDAYRRPYLTQHPCTWVAGFDDCTIPALPLSIGVYDSYAEAYQADLALWRSITVGQWYWIPGTNIIGAVCDGTTNAAGTPPPVGPDTPCIHDEHGHGTGTTSSVLSEEPYALLLVHEGNSGASALSTAPVVPDIQSHSWGPAGPLPLHAADPVLQFLMDRGLARPGAEDPATVFFIAAGNEAPFPTIVDAQRVHPSVQIVGGGFPGKATASSWSMFDFASWFCRPTAVPDSISAVRSSYCGTSFSAPTVAGAAAATLLDLRQREGYLGRSTPTHVTPTVTRDAFIEGLRHAATYEAEQRFDNTGSTIGTELALPEGQEHLFWGYGWLDVTRVDTAVACATGGDCPTPSADAQRWNEARQDARRHQTQSPFG